MAEDKQIVVANGQPETALRIRERELYAIDQAEARLLYESGVCPDAKSYAGVLVKIRAGRPYGLSALQSVNWVHIFQGHIFMAADLIVATVLKGGHGYLTYEQDKDGVTTTAHRIDFTQPPDKDGKPVMMPTFSVRWDRQRATDAGLINKDNWKKYFHTQCRHRGAAEAGRAYFADDVGDLYALEEMESFPRVLEPQEAGLTGTDKIRKGLGLPIPEDAPGDAVTPDNRGLENVEKDVDTEVTDEDITF